MTSKTIDAVKLMRELRDKLSREMEEMKPAERICYIRDKAASTTLGKSIAEGGTRADHDPDAADRSRSPGSPVFTPR